MDKCNDNRFEIIEKAKQDLLEHTNIDSSPDEMKVLDSFLFRCWQMGWLKQYNLTSDAEGEEMLTVSAITVREMYAANERIKTDAPDKELGRTSDHINHVLRCLFGSACLPDEVAVAENATTTQKKAEAKYNKGDMVVFKNTGKIKVVAGIEADGRYIVTTIDGNSPLCVRASDLQPYNSADPTQPNLAISAKSATPSREEIRKSRTFPEQMPSDGSDNSDNSDPHQSRNVSQNIVDCDKYFDIILKDIFSKERRLNIAATITAGMAAGWYHEPQSGSLNDKCQRIAKITFMLADALIAEADFPTDPLRPVKNPSDHSDDSDYSDSSENPTLSSIK